MLRRYSAVMIDSALVIAGGLYSAQLASLALAYVKCRAQTPRARTRGGVTLVRPVSGLEPHIEATLASSFMQDHPNYEVIFCVAREDDPVVALVRALMSRHPQVAACLLVGDQRISPNPKLNNMAKAWPAARRELVVFADSNVLLPRDYCERIEDAFAASNADIVSSPPVGDLAGNFWSEVECAMLNVHAARWQFAASALGVDFAQGKTIAFRRRSFGADLMSELAREPAEDAAATKLARERGLKLAVLAPPFVHPVGGRSLAQVWGRHVRWARLRRVTFPAMFSLEAACGLFPALVAFLLSATAADAPAWAALLLALGLWYGPEYLLARALGWRCNAWFLPASLARDALLPAFYVAAWTSGKFEWRGHSMDGAAKAPAR